MNILKYLMVFVWCVVEETESGGGHGKKHHELFKFHVPEIVNHNHHTKYIVIHHHPKPQVKKSQPKAKPEPKIPHFNFNSHHFKTSSHKHSSSHSGGHQSQAPVHVHQHVEHKVEKTPMHPVQHFHKTSVHHEPPQTPQVFGQTHTFKEVSTYNSNPFASSSPGHGSHSQNGYEVTENEEDHGLGNDGGSNTYSPSYGYGDSNQVTSPQTFGNTQHSDPFGGGLVADDENTHYSSDFNYVPSNEGYGQSYGVNAFGGNAFGGNTFGGNAYEASSSYESPGNNFGGNSEQLTDEYKEFLKSLSDGAGAAGGGLKSFTDDTTKSVSEETGFNKVYQSGGHQSVVY